MEEDGYEDEHRCSFDITPHICVNTAASLHHTAPLPQSRAGEVKEDGFDITLCFYLSTQTFPCAGEVEEDGYEDEYQLEDLEVTPADYIKPIVSTNFRKVGAGRRRWACLLKVMFFPVGSSLHW